jgi:hypothetical protein
LQIGEDISAHTIEFLRLTLRLTINEVDIGNLTDTGVPEMRGKILTM